MCEGKLSPELTFEENKSERRRVAREIIGLKARLSRNFLGVKNWVQPRLRIELNSIEFN